MKLFYFVQLLTKFNNFLQVSNEFCFLYRKWYFLIYITYGLYSDFYYIFFKYVIIFNYNGRYIELAIQSLWQNLIYRICMHMKLYL